MQEGKRGWQAGLKVYKEERADKAAPARFSCETAWALKNETEETGITAWYFSPEAHDVVSRFQTAWARKDTQDIIAWIFPSGETRHRRARQHSSGGKEDGRPDEEGQPAASIDIIGQARPAASHRPLSGRLRALGSTASSGHGSTAASSGHDISALSVEPGRAFTPGQEHLRRLLKRKKKKKKKGRPLAPWRPLAPSRPAGIAVGSAGSRGLQTWCARLTH